MWLAVIKVLNSSFDGGVEAFSSAARASPDMTNDG
jgi:hypothetical protein